MKGAGHAFGQATQHQQGNVLCCCRTLFSYLSFTKSNLQDILHPYVTYLAVLESWQMGALCIMCLRVRLAWGGIRLQCLAPTQPKDGCKSCLESRKILLFELNSEWNMKLVRHVLFTSPRPEIQSNHAPHAPHATWDGIIFQAFRK